MATDRQLILAIVERALIQDAPLASLQALTELRHELDLLERANVARALREGHTFTAIARPLGISRQAAHRRYRDLTTAPPPHRRPALSAEARAALLTAREEAARHGSRSIDGEHLLLAIAQTRPLGLDVDAARRTLQRPAIPAPEPLGLRPTLYTALVANNGPLRLEHLLQAAINDPGGGAKRLLDQLTITPQAVLDAL